MDAIGRVAGLAKSAISGTQYTKRMCAIIALDIRSVFNSDRRDNIMLSLKDFKMPNIRKPDE